MQRVHATVRGKVQGVWYRASTQRRAQALGLTGWVRNLPDGQVELVAEGDRTALEQLISWCRRGPEHARVQALEARWSSGTGAFTNFEIRR